jgi:hypothetical protein
MTAGPSSSQASIQSGRNRHVPPADARRAQPIRACFAQHRPVLHRLRCAASLTVNQAEVAAGTGDSADLVGYWVPQRAR